VRRGKINGVDRSGDSGVGVIARRPEADAAIPRHTARLPRSPHACLMAGSGSLAVTA
jgi:hypothetical protein